MISFDTFFFFWVLCTRCYVGTLCFVGTWCYVGTLCCWLRSSRSWVWVSVVELNKWELIKWDCFESSRSASGQLRGIVCWVSNVTKSIYKFVAYFENKLSERCLFVFYSSITNYAFWTRYIFCFSKRVSWSARKFYSDFMYEAFFLSS